MKNSLIKKILLAAVAILMVLSMAGCSFLPMFMGIMSGISAAEKELESRPAKPAVTTSPNAGTEEKHPDVGIMVQPQEYHSTTEHDGAPYSSIQYEEPDLDVLEASIDGLMAEVESGKYNVYELLERYESVLAAYNDVDSMYALAYVLYAHDVTNEYYDKEQQRLETGLNALDVKLTDVSLAILALDETVVRATWGDDFTDEVIRGKELNSEEIQELVKQESELSSQYDTYDSTFVYRVNGKEYSLSDINDVYYSDGYEAYIALWNGYFKEFNRGAGEIYLKLVAVRDQMAKMLGFKNFAEYRYACYGRDYTVEDIKNLQSYVKEYIVPLYLTMVLMEDGVGGADPEEQSYDKEAFMDTFAAVAEDFSPLLTESLGYMRKTGLYDFDNNENRMDSSFTTHFSTPNAPFMFITWKDSFRNASTLIHESGHYCNFYNNQHSGWSVADPLDLCEVDSQGLEMLMMYYYDVFYGDAAEKAAFSQLNDALYSVITGCMEDEFQTKVYENPNWTLDQMNAFYLQLAGEYGMELMYGYTGVEWSSIPHSFQSPMYYISYCVSMIPALEIWDLSQKNYDAAKNAYLSILMRDGYAKTRTVIREAGLGDPLSQDTIASIQESYISYLGQRYDNVETYFTYAQNLLDR